MRQCLLCEQEFIPPIKFAQIFSLKNFRQPKICFHCLNQFEKLTGNRCSVCSKMMEQGIICSDCKKWQKIYQGEVLHNSALYRYNSAFHDLMVAYKR